MIGEKKAARGEDGKTYYVPSDIKYQDWEKQYVNRQIIANQTQKITQKANTNSYSVDRKLL